MPMQKMKPPPCQKRNKSHRAPWPCTEIHAIFWCKQCCNAPKQEQKTGTRGLRQRPRFQRLRSKQGSPVPTMPPSGRRPFISRNGFPSDSPWLSERSARRARSEFHGAKAAPARFLCILSCACKKGCRPPGRVPASRNEKNSYPHTKTNNFSNKTT